MRKRPFKKKVPEYHFAMTIEATVYGKRQWSTVTGIVEVYGNRNDVFVNRWEFACNQLGNDPQDIKLIFWSLEPNELL